MLKRTFDFISALLGLIIFSPVLIICSLLIWLQDFANPFYIAPRVGKGGKLFKMFKFRSMIVNADKSGVDSTSSNDKRITKIGATIRKFKLDELPQLWNVLIGDMSIVGPRPNVKRDVDLYTKEEMAILEVRPGITDLSSIVFSDEGEILKDSIDPDIDYNQLIRPWKSRLCIIYKDNRTFFMDIKIIFFTLVAVIDKGSAIKGVVDILNGINAPENIKNVAARKEKLVPFPPPGMNEIVTKRSA